MLLFGSGGHSKVVLDSLLAKNITAKGIFDDHPIADIHYGTQVLGPYSPDIFPQEPIIISIGRNFTRQQVASRISHTFGSITHPLASVSHSSHLGHGTVVFQLSIIQADTVVGNHVIINSGAIVEHDCS
ncbi:MAG: acetyltransferase, partial [Cytophagales bacterium]|nr:acetyltransferase [Cytophagales bacterium]